MYMRRCLQLAANGLGRVRPNPLVGCVVVNDGRITTTTPNATPSCAIIPHFSFLIQHYMLI